jgi:hypothetical protein
MIQSCCQQPEIYNYGHCLARRICENAFGILCQYFMTFFTPIAVDPDTTLLIVFVACIVYNFLSDEHSSPLPRRKVNADFEAYNVRNQF